MIEINAFPESSVLDMIKAVKQAKDRAKELAPDGQLDSTWELRGTSDGYRHGLGRHSGRLDGVLCRQTV